MREKTDKKNSFVLYTDYEEPINMLSDVQMAQLLRGIFTYVRTGEQHSDDPMVTMLLMMICNQIDRDYSKYEETRERRREAGRRGGQKRAAVGANGTTAEIEAEPDTVQESVCPLAAEEAPDMAAEQDAVPMANLCAVEYLQEEAHLSACNVSNTKQTQAKPSNGKQTQAKDSKTNQSQANLSNAKQKKQSLANQADNVYVNENVTVNGNENVTENGNVTVSINTCGGGGDHDGRRTAPAREADRVFMYEHLPTTTRQLALVRAFTDKLFATYRHTPPSEADFMKVYEYVYRPVTQEDGVSIAAFDEDKAALLEYAFRQGVEGGYTGWNYISGIYQNFAIRGITTVEEAERYDFERSMGRNVI